MNEHAESAPARCPRGGTRILTLAAVLTMGTVAADDCPAPGDGDFPACGDGVAAVAPQGAIAPAVLETRASGIDGVEMVRITGPVSPGGQAPRHAYSRRQPWNADETLFLTSESVLDGQGYAPVTTTLRLSSEAVWSSTDPDVLIGIAYDPQPNVLASWNVRTDQLTEIERLEEFSSCSIGSGEGNPSDDGTRIVLACRTAGSSATSVLVAKDLSTGTELGRLPAAANYNWASFSRSGDHVLVENTAEGTPRSLMRYAPDFTGGQELTTRVEHGDLATDADGRDVFVMIDWDGLVFIDIESGKRVHLPVRGGSDAFGYGHVSCQAPGRPGWCYVSTHVGGLVGAFRVGVDNDGLGRFPLTQRLGLRTRGLSAFETWGKHVSTASSYAAQPKASVSPSGRQIAFSSDWNGTIAASDFVLRVAP